ncbi:helix-turn-helix domain-containing protein [Salarchaeum sp. III]
MVVFAESRIESLPPSAKLVYKVLETESPLTQADIRERSRLSKRTTRHAIGLLADAELVDERVYPLDARKKLYAPQRPAKPSTGMTE